MHDNKVFTEFYEDCQMEHGLDTDVTCITCDDGGGSAYPRKIINTQCKSCIPF